MRRPLVLAAVAIVVGAGIVAAPAQAARFASTCKTVFQTDDQTNKVCLAVDYHSMAGVPGIEVDRMTLSVNSADVWSSPTAESCYSVRIVNANGVNTWLKTGSNCDIPTYPGDIGFVPIQEMPQSTYAWVMWNGNANVKNAADVDFVVSLKLTQ